MKMIFFPFFYLKNEEEISLRAVYISKLEKNTSKPYKMSLTVSSRMVIKAHVFIITVWVCVETAMGVRKLWPWVTVNVYLSISVKRKVPSGPKASGSVV